MMRYPKYIEKESYKRVVSVARSYDDNKEKIKEIEENIIFSMFSAHSSEGGKSNAISKPTELQAEQILKYTTRLKEYVDAVDKSIAVFDQEQQEIIRKHVIENIKATYCPTEVSERTVQRIRHDFLVTLAVNLGEIF